ncbi:MAG TPA: hypothetical protein VKU36_05330 [Candidatus Babeliales bacterium]|nr:hypothetical protein [Candidatus Babeliales bacterium]
MKNIKNMLLTSITILCSFTTHISQAGTSALLKKVQGPGFELFNKAPNTITVTVFIDNKFSETRDVAPQGKLLKNIDVNQPIQIGIYNQVTKISTGFLSREITPQPDYFYEINAPGKTKYVTWNPAKSPSLYSQTGPLMGLMGKTESGYPLSDLTKQEIVKIK